MTKKFAWLGVAAIAGLMTLLVWTGCGGNDNAQQAQNLLNTATNGAGGGTASDTLASQIDQLKQLEMTVEIVENGKPHGKWSQKNGSWRWDDANDPTSYIIYNNQRQKTWVVTGDKAVESTGSADQSYAAFNPALILGAYAYFPRTGGSGDTWEYNVPGQGKLTIEFKGPNGLPSQMVIEDATAGTTDTTVFNYTNVGSVPDSLFELPSNVKTKSVDGGTDTTGINLPSLPGGSRGQQ